MKILIRLFFIAILFSARDSLSLGLTSKPKIIFLCGTSYSGKSSVREWIMRNSSHGFLWTGTDLAVKHISMLGDFKSGAYKNYSRYLDLKVDEESGQVIFPSELDVNKENYPRLIGLWHILPRVIFDTLVKQGCHNIIVDEDFGPPGTYISYFQCIDPEKFDVYVVKLRVTEETAKARSAVRDGAQIPYYQTSMPTQDLLIDADDMTVEEIGQQILDYIENNAPNAINSEPLSTYYDPALISRAGWLEGISEVKI